MSCLKANESTFKKGGVKLLSTLTLKALESPNKTPHRQNQPHATFQTRLKNIHLLSL